MSYHSHRIQQLIVVRMEQLQEILGNSDYSGAVKYCSTLELQIHENLDKANPESVCLFYSLNMIAFLIIEDLNGAKYLWKRVPEMLKTNQILASIWNIGKMLWIDDVAGALNATKSDWPDSVALHINYLCNELIRQQLSTFSSAYSVIPILKLSKSLALSPDEAVEMVIALGWRVDLDSQLVYPLSRNSGAANKEGAIAKLHDNLTLMDKITSHAAHLEKVSGKVDLNAKNESVKIK